MPTRLQQIIDECGGYWEGECPTAPVEDWKYEVANGDTRKGYWEWVYAVTEEE